jgi:short subunit dehydrogenase-like uncharacterized protein
VVANHGWPTLERVDRHDIVLLGATGFTGGLTAEYLARNSPPGLRWAVAGRDVTRVNALAERLTALSAGSKPVRAVRVDVTDAVSVRAAAESTRVLASTVGPFMEYGEPVVAACAATGTDYLDITGEPEFVDRMWLKYHDQAMRTGSRLVHCCGFDSVPHDLGVWFTLRHLPEGVPLVVEGFVRANAGFSAGTYHSAVRAFGRARQSRAIAGRRRASESRTTGRRVRALPARIKREPESRRWAVPLPTIDPVVVRRSARALDRYGPDFAYGHYAVVGGPHLVAGTVAGATGLLVVSQIPAARDALLRLRSAGEGPAADRRAKSWFRVRFAAGGGGRRVLTEVVGGDPGYEETAKMLAESALCLALDDLPECSGQVTTVQAMGDALLARLERADLTFRLVRASEAG